ncbi:MAG: ATP-binding cassette domain-containing protein [Comamonadaceae bacterium]|nr:MAG: ATP-binding cassette domain-containing protein [Comamonadaceae bacterium]
MIRTRGLAFRYADGPELQFGDIDVGQGGVLLLSGASGSGKSTWLALAAALLAPSSGDIVVAGQSLPGLGQSAGDAWRSRSIGFLPQKLHLSGALTVHDNLAMAQWATGQPQDDERIAAALAALGVQNLAQRRPAQLSGGQAQRVALARAVLLRPAVILADEPTASLDDEAAGAALDLLRSAARIDHATLVIATHDSRVASYFGNNDSNAGTATSLHRLTLKKPLYP